MKKKIEQILAATQSDKDLIIYEVLPYDVLMSQCAEDIADRLGEANKRAAAAIAEMVEGEITENDIQAAVEHTRELAELEARLDEDKWDVIEAINSVWHDIEDEHLAKLAAKEAKMAEMADALNWLVHLCHGCSKGGDEYSPPSDTEWRAAIESGEKALSSAPRALFAGEGRWLTDLTPGRSDLILLETYQEADGQQIEIGTTNYLGRGQHVRVIALAKEQEAE